MFLRCLPDSAGLPSKPFIIYWANDL